MDREMFAQIMNDEDSVGSKLMSLKDDNAFVGLQIIRKYLPTSGVEGADHDIIYSVSIDRIVDAGITEEDTRELRAINWMIDEDTDSLACFV